MLLPVADKPTAIPFLYRVPVLILTHVIIPTSYPVSVMTFEVYIILSSAHVRGTNTGLIRYTDAVASQVLNHSSLNIYVNTQFPVNVYPLNHQLFVITIASDAQVNVTTTGPSLANQNHGLYSTVAVGFVTSLNIR